MLYFISSFVEDLLHLKMLREGDLQIESYVFEPEESLYLIRDIFEPQAHINRTRIKVIIDNKSFT